MIYQRIRSQNKGELIQFIAKISYNDKSMVTLNSINDFVTYNEIKQVIPNAIHLSWTYLIQFPDKEYPEKQQISVSFISGKAYSRITEFDIVTSRIGGPNRGGIVQYNIKHTSRSWGVDIENLLTNHINTILDKQKQIVGFIKNNKFVISAISSLCITYGLVRIGFKYISHLKEVNLIDVNTALNKLGSDLNGKVNYLTKYIAMEQVNKYADYKLYLILGGIIVFIILLAFIHESLDVTEESHILLTEEAKKYQKLSKENILKQWRVFIFTLITGVLTGVGGNFIYAYLISR